ncbi:MAG TPA: valine--tRNA ligase [Puia sp.]|nr:valine--tRNA ligase [Puia sp.]
MELSKHYDPALVEDKWYKHWNGKKYFQSEPDSDKEPFTLVIPPPNVTGVLHMGHTLNETVQDILARRARSEGFNVCWIPGSDHASIATEARIVQMLKDRGIEKNSLTREEFLQYAFEWTDKYSGIIYSQIKKLGCSVDWTKVTFTMDEHYYKAVMRVFVTLYQKGLIYRGARMVNWDPQAKTALSDEEVEYKETPGKLYYVKYKLTDGGSSDGDFLVVATQRPETIMGDVAVCLNPKDIRQQHLKGRKVKVPLVDREVPIIFDEYVDPEFGTGVLKITPAHDVNDYNLGIKYNLPVINTLNEDGTLSESAQIYVGLDRFKARKKVVEELISNDLLVKEEDYVTRIGYSQRTNAVVEPRISTQWFLRMKELAVPALEAVNDGKIKIHPEDRFINTYRHWLENVEDWCISRQLWWGQQIPAWYDELGNVYVAESEEEAKAKSDAVGLNLLNKSLTQDKDVLDTWFSSWLWPIEVFNGITEPGNRYFKYYYPTSVLVTGQDIIFFWVARMIIAGFEFENERPFRDVYFTGMVRDKEGRKMSKSLGNSPDLLELISKYGADAVRFGIMISSPAGNDLLFDEASLEQGRNFNNKLWNALKLVRMWEKNHAESGEEENDNLSVQWFDSRLEESKIAVKTLFADFRLSEALKQIYSLIWDDFCSWYLEWIKPEYQKPISSNLLKKTIYFFDELLLLLHPFMPFITEEIFQTLRGRTDDLCVKKQTDLRQINKQALNYGEFLKKCISEIRNVKAKFELKSFGFLLTSSDQIPMAAILRKLFKGSTVKLETNFPQGLIPILIDGQIIYIEAEQDIHQKEDLEKDLHYQRGFLQSVLKKLNNERFIQNARPEVIELEQRKKASAEENIRKIEEELAKLKS